MSNLVIQSNNEVLEILKKMYAPIGATDLEFAILLQIAKQTGLDPIRRQIAMILVKGEEGYKPQIYVTIDGLRSIADATGEYEGQTKPEWCGPDGKWVDVWLSDKPPSAARIGVYRKGFREPVYGIATFQEVAGRKSSGELSFMWKHRPAHMLAKVAEAFALRKAFPQKLASLYVREEFPDAIEGSVVEVQEQPQIAQLEPEAENGNKKSIRPMTAEQLKRAFNRTMAHVSRVGVLNALKERGVEIESESQINALFEAAVLDVFSSDEESYVLFSRYILGHDFEAPVEKAAFILWARDKEAASTEVINVLAAIVA